VLGSGDRKGVDLDRRRFLLTSGVALGVAAVAGVGGRLLLRHFDVAGDRAALDLPTPSSGAAALPAGADLAARVDGLTPLFTDNRRLLPGRHRDQRAADPPGRLPALADRHVRLAPQLHARRPVRRDDLIERDVTLTCVSNEVGGTLAGSARWLGVPLGALLRENGVRSGATSWSAAQRRHDDRRTPVRRSRSRTRCSPSG
jgi:DMSO/TMAO reductase YedYZ molybdopterin-dependent catalytic subunit